MSHPIQCQCGNLQGSVETGHPVNRGVCYCRDCQAFARFLKREADILDGAGGTDVVQTEPRYVSFHQGQQHLACVCLTPRLLRWYAACCNTPIGNTLPNMKAAFVGLIHSCLEHAPASLDESFGPVRMHVHTRHARGEQKPKQVGFAPAALRVLTTLVRARLDGSYRQTPFFGADGRPVATPLMVGAQELQTLKGKS